VLSVADVQHKTLLNKMIHIISEKFEYHSSNSGNYQFEKRGILYLQILVYIFMRAKWVLQRIMNYSAFII